MASHKKVALITHTGSDMPLDEAAGLGITIIPDKVLFGDEEYRNMTEISSQMFYEKLAAAEKLPTSSQPSLGDFVKAYRKAAEEADEVLCLMITSKMSGCYAAALSAAQMVKRQGLQVPVYVYDTQQCSHGMAQMVRAAAELAGAGFASSEIIPSSFAASSGKVSEKPRLKAKRRTLSCPAVQSFKFSAASFGIKKAPPPHFTTTR